MARKYAEYKKDPTIKTPIIAWLFDRGFVQLFFTAITGVSIVALVLLFTTGANAWKRISTEPEDVSPYQEISSTNSPGRNWAETLINITPQGLSGWTVSDVLKPQNIQAPNCAFNDNPSTTILSTHMGSSGTTQTRVLLYGAGQAGADFDKYAKTLQECANAEIIDEEFGKSAVFDNGFIITMGDAIVNVVATDNEQRDVLKKFYYDQMTKTLKESSCLDLDVSGNDATRSFYYNSEKYDGYKETTVVETQVDFKNAPTVPALNIDEINNPDVSQPESPLPQDFPALPKEAVSKPELPKEVENKDSFSADAVYNIADVNGPGCGWAWSSQKQPIYDETELAVEKNTTIVSKQNNVDEAAQTYVNQKKDWAMKTVQVMPAVNNWNQYAKDVNNVHDKWIWLNSERDKLYDPWHQYVEEHNEWETFDKRKSDALNTYNDNLEICMDKQEAYLDWEEKWGDLYAQQKAEENAPEEPTQPEETPEPTDTPTDPENPVETPTATPTPTEEPAEPVDVPEPPENCTTLPERPAIIDQEKPAEPQAPQIPEGVTIPDSWEKP